MPAPIGNKYAEGGEGPSKYQKKFDRQAYKLCLLRYTDKDLADFFEVDEGTINNWKKDHPSFFKALTRGKAIADADVANALHKRALGYSYEEVTYEKVDIKPEDKENIKKETYKKKVVVKEIAPDPGAALSWLKNRQPKKWRDKVEHGVTDADGNDIVTLFQIPDNGRNKDNQTAKGLPGESAEQSG